jgi:molybdopterin molybdotransferase
MAQLSDDCFAFGGPLMRLDEMAELLDERIAPIPDIETVAVGVADGRVLAHDLMAGTPVPPFDNSAVDGYAVRFADLRPEQETNLPISDYRLAGHVSEKAITPRTAVRIFTGAAMPDGADTVFMQEDCREDAGHVFLPPGLKRGANRRFAGEDVATGSVILEGGRRLRPQDVAIAAAVGAAHVEVRRRIRVAVFSTGDEVVDAGSTRAKTAIFDANRPLIAAMLDRLGAEVTDLGILKDDVNVLLPALREAASEHDLVLTTGGVSTGEADYVRDAVEAAGKLVFWRVAIKPGRPVAMGLLPKAGPGEHAVFAGLPGNPVAAFVTFVFVLRPRLLRLAGAKHEEPLSFPALAGFSYRKKQGRREYVRVSLRRTADGRYEAHRYKKDGAGILSSLTDTQGLVALPEDITEIAPGDTVAFLPYEMLLG